MLIYKIFSRSTFTFNLFIILSILTLCLSTANPASGTVVGSKHDLSSNSSNQVCVYCHTPHFANTDVSPPLWNRNAGNVSYTVYASATMNTKCSNPPTGVSLLCMSCHDGVNANDNKHTLVFVNGSFNTGYPVKCTGCHEPHGGGEMINKMAFIGTDLSNDHPISMPYPTLGEDPYFNPSPDAQNGWGGNSPNDVKLYAGRVECPSCHNVHDPTMAPFLRKTNAGSILCLTCHIK